MRSKAFVITMAAAVGAVVFFMIPPVNKDNEKNVRVFYEKTKKDLGVSGNLSEGSIEYNPLWRKLRIESPSLRLIPGQTNKKNYDVEDYYSYDVKKRNLNPAFLAASQDFMRKVIPGDAGLLLKAKNISIGYDGNSEYGFAIIKINGISFDSPFITDMSGRIVSASDIFYEILPIEYSLDGNALLNRNQYRWYTNSVNFMPGIGNWIVNATGAFGATADIELSISRYSSGGGRIALTTTYDLNGSQIGKIKKYANFEHLPNLDVVMHTIGNVAKALAASSQMAKDAGEFAMADAIEFFARESRATDYAIEYTGFKLISKLFNGVNMSDLPSVGLACKRAGISMDGFIDGEKNFGDSHCGIALKLSTVGSYKEKLSLRRGGSLFDSVLHVKRQDARIE